MNPDWNKKVVAATIANFYNQLSSVIPTYVEGAARATSKVNEWYEIRITDLRWRRVDATQYICRLAVNILVNTPSGQGLVEGSDVYRVEELLGIAEAAFIGISIEGMGCMDLDDGQSASLTQFRPRQIGTASNLKQASVTGKYLLRFNQQGVD